jgi:cyanate lyase
MDRTTVTQKIIAVKVKQGLRWADIAQQIGQSKEWTTAALLGQMKLTAEQAAVAKSLFANCALQRLAAHSRSYRPAYLPVLRVGKRVWPNL